jgi:hypothetical protein
VIDGFALLGHPAVAVAIAVAIVAVALVVFRRRRRRRTRPPLPAPPPAQPPDAAYLDSSHIIEGPVVGGGERPGSPDRPRER